MDLNEVQRRLKGENPNLAYVLSWLYERMAAMSKDMDQMSSLILHLTHNMHAMATISERDRAMIQRQLARLGQPSDPNVKVESVVPDPEKEH